MVEHVLQKSHVDSAHPRFGLIVAAERPDCSSTENSGTDCGDEYHEHNAKESLRSVVRDGLAVARACGVRFIELAG